jgi:hypothetical protein
MRTIRSLTTSTTLPGITAAGSCDGYLPAGTRCRRVLPTSSLVVVEPDTIDGRNYYPGAVFCTDCDERDRAVAEPGALTVDDEALAGLIAALAGDTQPADTLF